MKKFLKLNDMYGRGLELVKADSIIHVEPFNFGSKIIFENGRNTCVLESPKQIFAMISRSLR